MIKKIELVILGAGPGGYSAAFRAADLGKQVILIERHENLGGVCLNVGCIPSKTLLHAAKVLEEAKHLSAHGIHFDEPRIDLNQLRNWKNNVISKLTQGLKAMAQLRQVEVITGYGKFSNKNEIQVQTQTGILTIQFEKAIVASGSEPIQLPFLPQDPRILDSTGALDLPSKEGHLLVLGGGIIGLEMATVYSALGMQISVVEMQDSLMGGFDSGLIKIYEAIVKKRYENIWLNTKVTRVEAKPDGLYVNFEGQNSEPERKRFDFILSAVGRVPNGKKIGAEKAGIFVDERGFIPVDKQQRTNLAHIFAIGDIVGPPMLAHKAIPEGRLAAEVIAGKKYFFTPKTIPAVAYTDPEIAWTGITEKEAKENGLNYETAIFPWKASGRALTQDRTEGLTKVIFDKQTHRLLGCAILGINAGDLISEATLAIEMGCDAEDIALTIHPHPTLSETFPLAAELFEGTITDLPNPRKKA